MDRWSVVCTLNYLPRSVETEIVLAKLPGYQTEAGRKTVESMVALADLTRKGFMAGDISTVMSPRTVLTWAENAGYLAGNVGLGFQLSFLNKCDELERPVIAEYFQRAFGEDLVLDKAA